MITARNYTAQAERDLISLASNYTDKDDSRLIVDFANQLKSAVHFALPDGGRIFDDELKGIDGLEVNCPFPLITVEYFESGAKCLVLAKQIESTFFVTECALLDGRWIPHPLTMVLRNVWSSSQTSESLTHVKYEGPRKPGSISLVCDAFVNFNTLWKGINRQSRDIDYQKYCINSLARCARNVFELIEALTCKNVTTEPLEKIDAKVNARRVKAGKLPLYETRILTIKTTELKHTAGKQGASHASPRQHLRRGHIRRLESGNVWVNSCIVGDPAKGIIKKSYSVV